MAGKRTGRDLERAGRSVRAWAYELGGEPGVAVSYPGTCWGKDYGLCLDLMAERNGRPVATSVQGHLRASPEELMPLALAEIGGGAAARLGQFAREQRGRAVPVRIARAIAQGTYPAAVPARTGREGPRRGPLAAELSRLCGQAVRDAAAGAGFSSGFMEGLSLLPAGPSENADWSWADLLFAQGPAGASFRAFSRDYPLLSWMVPNLKGPVSAVLDGRSPAEALFPYAPNPEALMRRFRGVGAGDPHPEVTRHLFGREPHEVGSSLRLLSGLPIDWLAPGIPEVEALAEVARHLPAASMILRSPAGTLAASCGGRFEDFLRRCGAWDEGNRLARTLRERAGEAADGAEDLARRILAPLLARSYAETGEGPGDEAAIRARASDMAREILFARKGLPAIVERSARWHAMLPAIDAAMPREGLPEQRWEPACPPFAAGGVEVRSLSSAGELRDEGARGPDAEGVAGLDHCVSGYAGRCASGAVAILSVRRPARGREPARRLSTAEIAWGGPDGATPEVVQHRGCRNGPPPADAVRALDACLARGGFVRHVPPPGSEPFDRIARDCGYDWTDNALVEAAVAAYDPALPAALRGLGAHGLARRLGLAAPDVAGFSPGL